MTICFDSYWKCFCLFKTHSKSVLESPIEPSRALCNKAKDESFTDNDLEKLESFKFGIERVKSMKMLDEKTYLLVDYKSNLVDYSSDNIRTAIRYYWNP